MLFKESQRRMKMWILYLWIVACMAVSAPFLQGFYQLFRMHYRRTHNVKQSLVKTIQTISWIVYLLLYQRMKHNVRLVGKGEYEIDYVLHEELYHFRVHGPRGPYTKKVLQVINEDDEDITEDIRPFLGPLEDFHGQTFTPSRLGYRQLTLNLYNGDTIEFKAEDPILIKTESITDCYTKTKDD